MLRRCAEEEAQARDDVMGVIAGRSVEIPNKSAVNHESWTGRESGGRGAEISIIEVEGERRADVVSQAGYCLVAKLPIRLVCCLLDTDNRNADAIVQGHDADPSTEVRRNRPAEVEIINCVDEQGIRCAISFRGVPSYRLSVVVLVSELSFEPKGIPRISHPQPDIESVSPGFKPSFVRYPVNLIFQLGPTAFSADIKTYPVQIWELQQLRVCGSKIHECGEHKAQHIPEAYTLHAVPVQLFSSVLPRARIDCPHARRVVTSPPERLHATAASATAVDRRRSLNRDRVRLP